MEGRRIHGFDDPAVCMTGVETRTSAPLRMGRNEERISPTVGGFLSLWGRCRLCWRHYECCPSMAQKLPLYAWQNMQNLTS